MSAFANIFAAQRRLFILRFLVEMGGELNEGVIHSAAIRGGFSISTRDDIRADLDHFKRMGCTSEEWLDALRIVRITEHGEDVAYGRAEAAGIEHTRWVR